ncbi:hypothetical protein P43SY_001413 [Pythium insidiosum]|uniref:Elicitin n=1 Tax=Pythium insidiosum TaxID=114742 RepID=A0AAD5LNF7_PYTIN|nr:hypothetical protein P43SY_001413 [Pythium insidiosum]
MPPFARVPAMMMMMMMMMALSLSLSLSLVTGAAAANATLPSSSFCDPQLLFQKLYVLMPAINQCAKESDYLVMPDNLTFPSTETLDRYCRSENCTKLALELDNAGLPSCLVPVGNATMPFRAFFQEVRDHCNQSNNGGGKKSAAALPSGSMAVARLLAVIALHVALGAWLAAP